MSRSPLIDMDRIEKLANAVVDSVKQLESSVDTAGTKLTAAELRKQTLANTSVILALYKNDDLKECSDPTIIISDSEQQVYASVVCTCYDADLEKTDMLITIEGPKCSSDFEALEGLYKLPRAAVTRARALSLSEEGFDDWDDLDLWC